MMNCNAAEARVDLVHLIKAMSLFSAVELQRSAAHLTSKISVNPRRCC
jgi:hypothetical protein